MRLCPSSVRAGKAFPPSNVLEPLIERTNNHWYWLGDFTDNGVDRYATLSWAPPAEAAGLYVVARVLWAHARGDAAPARVALGNACGLFTCINPAHWVEVTSNRKKKFSLPKDCGARPCALGSGHGKIVHVVRDEDAYTVCGLTRFSRMPAVSTVINCKDCIATWRSKNAPLIEVE